MKTNETKQIALVMAAKEDLELFTEQNGEKKFRAEQIMDWIQKKLVADPDAMTNLPPSTKNALKENFRCSLVKAIQKDEADDGSAKYLLGLSDGETVECAVIPAEDGRKTFCLSSQVGCPVGCLFCASGAGGLTRNLEAAEIVEEYMLLARENGGAPDNVVMMGIGEPLLNFNNLIAALETICDPDGMALAQRRVTISTSGWTPGIRNLAERGKQWNLAVSLHAPDDSTRGLLIPAKYRRDIKDIMQACRMHREETGRMLTFEYVLLAGVNDSPEQARAFARIAYDARAKVNLIPYNKARGSYKRPSRDAIKRFENVLKTLHIPVTTRVEKGFTASAACGQLRASKAVKNDVPEPKDGEDME